MRKLFACWVLIRPQIKEAAFKIVGRITGLPSLSSVEILQIKKFKEQFSALDKKYHRFCHCLVATLGLEL